MDILIIDDDAALAKGIALYLHSSNPEYEVKTAVNGEEALAEIARSRPDLIVLDVMLPDASGFELCGRIKADGDIPVIFLSSLGEEEDRVRGLLTGGDDYMVKPFSLPELSLRINARLRERKKERTGASPGETVHRFGEIEVKNHRLVKDEVSLSLTEKEYGILLLLARNEGRPVTLEEIYEVVWGEAYKGDLRTVQSHMANLRKKLAEVYGTKDHIRTRWGDGYIFLS